MIHDSLTESIIGCYYEVYNTLGFGFLEQVYENAMQVELLHKGLIAKRQQPITVRYRNTVVGEYFADILVNDSVILELKTADHSSKAHEAQLHNYLRATGIRVGLLLYFSENAKVRRIIYPKDQHVRVES